MLQQRAHEDLDILEPDTAVVLSGLARADAELAALMRAVVPLPRPDERYHVRGLTWLWVERVAGRESVHTRRSYTHALTRWLDYCLRHHVDPLAARRADVDDWIAVGLAGLAGQTINARVSGIRSWYGYLISNDIEARDPTAHIDRPTRVRGRSATPWLNEDQLNALLDQANQRLIAAQHALRDHDAQAREEQVRGEWR